MGYISWNRAERNGWKVTELLRYKSWNGTSYTLASRSWALGPLCMNRLVAIAATRGWYWFVNNSCIIIILVGILKSRYNKQLHYGYTISYILGQDSRADQVDETVLMKLWGRNSVNKTINYCDGRYIEGISWWVDEIGSGHVFFVVEWTI